MTERVGLAGMSPLAGVSGKPRNILVLGVDRRPDTVAARDGVRADTIMLARLSPQTGRIKVVSIPRDLLVQVEPGVEDKINAAYSYGGVPEMTGAVERYTGVSIDHYVIVDFEGFEETVDVMGGVSLRIQDEFPDKFHLEEGEIRHLNGRKALLYARYRPEVGGDLERIERQQQLMAALRSRALKWGSLKRVPGVAVTVAENVDTDMSVRYMASLGRTLLKRGPGALMTYTKLEGTPITLSDGTQALEPDNGANEDILEEFLE